MYELKGLKLPRLLESLLDSVLAALATMQTEFPTAADVQSFGHR